MQEKFISAGSLPKFIQKRRKQTASEIVSTFLDCYKHTPEIHLKKYKTGQQILLKKYKTSQKIPLKNYP